MKEIRMKNFIKNILLKLCCMHVWYLFKQIKVETDFGWYWQYIVICKKCGKIKKVKSN